MWNRGSAPGLVAAVQTKTHFTDAGEAPLRNHLVPSLDAADVDAESPEYTLLDFNCCKVASALTCRHRHSSVLGEKGVDGAYSQYISCICIIRHISC